MPAVRFQVGTFTVNLESYQWGFQTGQDNLERLFGTSGGGRLFRESLLTVRRLMVVHFLRQDVDLDALRELGIVASKTSAAVVFYPDTSDLGTFFNLDWPLTVIHERVVENRQTVEVAVTERLA